MSSFQAFHCSASSFHFCAILIQYPLSKSSASPSRLSSHRLSYIFTAHETALLPSCPDAMLSPSQHLPESAFVPMASFPSVIHEAKSARAEALSCPAPYLLLSICILLQITHSCANSPLNCHQNLNKVFNTAWHSKPPGNKRAYSDSATPF